jgi:hypothetical protein
MNTHIFSPLAGSVLLLSLVGCTPKLSEGDVYLAVDLQ